MENEKDFFQMNVEEENNEIEKEKTIIEIKNEKENIRHEQVMIKINQASTKEEVPNITPSMLSNYLANFVEFNGIKLNSREFANIYQNIVDYGSFASFSVKDIFVEILRKNYPDMNEEDYLKKYIEVVKDLKFNHIVQEIYTRYEKLNILREQEELNFHNNVMKEIQNCFDIKTLPKVSEAVLVSYMQRSLKTNYGVELSTEKLYQVTNLLLDTKLSQPEKNEELEKKCRKLTTTEWDFEDLFVAIITELLNNKKVSYLIEEIITKEQRIEFIYKNDHEEVMTQINDARRISQLPKGYSTSTITGYLSSNSMIYPKGKTIPAGEFIEISNLLMQGKRFEDREIINALARIILDYYPDKVEEAFTLLITKLSSLPKIYYIAEETSEVLKKQEEFTVRGTSNVNVYFVPNPKSPIEAGKFYNCYISRAKNLNLEDILPLKLEEIVPPSMDVDSIEWYVQEYYDPTFKTAGGVILNKDETIGNVNVFQPSDGKIGITPEEKNKYSELELLSQQVKSIIAKKKKETSEFAKMQEAFLRSQQETDRELAELEEKIDSLTSEKGRGR